MGMDGGVKGRGGDALVFGEQVVSELVEVTDAANHGRGGHEMIAIAQEFLEQVPHTVRETVDAGKDRRGRAEAIALARSVRRVVTGRGNAVVTFDMKAAPPEDDTLAAAILGPTGNLKAPTLKVGDTLLVGFNEEAYKQVLGTP